MDDAKRKERQTHNKSMFITCMVMWVLSSMVVVFAAHKNHYSVAFSGLVELCFSLYCGGLGRMYYIGWKAK